MIFQKNKTFLLSNTLKLFLLYFLLQTSFGTLHKHTEINLHFHAENIITKDHTISAEEDCAVCPAILAASLYLIGKGYLFLKSKISTFEAISYLPLFLFPELTGVNLGRSPPSFS